MPRRAKPHKHTQAHQTAMAKIALRRARTALLIEQAKLAKLRADAPDAPDFTGATLAERLADYDPTPEERAMIRQRMDVLRGRIADGSVTDIYI